MCELITENGMLKSLFDLFFFFNLLYFKIILNITTFANRENIYMLECKRWG